MTILYESLNLFKRFLNKLTLNFFKMKKTPCISKIKTKIFKDSLHLEIIIYLLESICF